MKLQDRDLKSKYEGATDEELILRLHEGEEGITEYILNKYKNLVRSKAKSMYILGADSEDYDYGRDASFLTFADLCVSRQMYTAVTASGRKKHMPLNTYISLSSKDDSNDEESGRFSLEETLVFDSDNPERIVIDRENVEDIEHFIDTELSSFEKEVLDLYLTGMSYTSIAKVLSKDEKSTDNALQRAKSKLKKKLSK